MPPLPDFVSLADQVYLLWSPALSVNPNPVVGDLEAEAARLLASPGFEHVLNAGKPVILAAAYPSTDGSSAGCPDGDVSRWMILDKADRPTPGSIGDVQEQVDIFNALFSTVNSREDIAGVVIRGMYFPAPLQDPSLSVDGESA